MSVGSLRSNLTLSIITPTAVASPRYFSLERSRRLRCRTTRMDSTSRRSAIGAVFRYRLSVPCLTPSVSASVAIGTFSIRARATCGRRINASSAAVVIRSGAESRSGSARATGIDSRLASNSSAVMSLPENFLNPVDERTDKKQKAKDGRNNPKNAHRSSYQKWVVGA